mgnify:CR=1 FL=1
MAEEEREVEAPEPEPAQPKIRAREVHRAPQPPAIEPPTEAAEKKTAPTPLEEIPFDLEERAAYVEANESDYEARLELARALWRTGDVDEAVEHYMRLIRASDLLDQVIDDLESFAAQAPKDPQPLQTLGDAYMKDGNLEQALKAYKQAMGLF